MLRTTTSHRWVRGGALAAVALALAAALPAAASGSTAPAGVAHGTLGPGDHTLTVRAGGLQRTLILHVPPGAATATRPLLLVFHGHGDTAESTATGTDFEQVANQTDEVVAFLQGIDNAWNDQAHPVSTGGPNDVAFAGAAITAIERHVTFDHARIVAVGFSNGALMVEDLGCKLASKLEMIVPVEGELAVKQSAHCTPARSLWVYEVHGTADTAIPYDGGQFGGSNGPVELSAPKSVARWAALDHCTTPPKVRAVSSTITLTTYKGCRHHVTATLRTIIGGVHQWGSNIGLVVHAALPT